MTSTYKQNVFVTMLAAGLESSGLTQEELAARTGVGQQAVSGWLTGKRPRPERVGLIAKALNLDFKDLMLAFGESRPAPSPRVPRTSSARSELKALSARVDRLEARLDGLVRESPSP